MATDAADKVLAEMIADALVTLKRRRTGAFDVLAGDKLFRRYADRGLAERDMKEVRAGIVAKMLVLLSDLHAGGVRVEGLMVPAVVARRRAS